MSIGSIGKVGGLQPSAVTGSSHSPRGAFQQLAQLLAGGQLSAASTAVTTLKSLLQPATPAASPAAATTPAATAPTSAAVSGGSGTLDTDLQGLSQALKSGDTTSARAAFAKFAADARLAGAFAHHRHGGDRMVAGNLTAGTTAVAAGTANNAAAAAGWLSAAANPANAASSADATRYRTLDLRA